MAVSVSASAASFSVVVSFVLAAAFAIVVSFSVASAFTAAAVAAAAFALPAALLGDPYDGQCKQDDQNDQRDDSTKCQHFSVPLFRKERFPHPVYTILPRRATGSQKKKCDFFKIRACILAKAVL